MHKMNKAICLHPILTRRMDEILSKEIMHRITIIKFLLLELFSSEQ